MDKTITVTERNIYGNVFLYPACDTSRMLCEIAGTRQVTLAMVGTIKRNGFKILVQPSQARKI